MTKRIVLISPVDGRVYDFFKNNFHVIKSDCLSDFISYERYHADMQVLNLKGNLFVNSNCRQISETLDKMNLTYTKCDGIGCRYPDNVALNAVLAGNNLLCKEKALHPKVKEFCIRNNIKILNVNQGYTKCSTLVLNENTIITDDESIARVSLINNINVLKIRKGNIYLDDKTVGFIGGASAVINDTVYFFGDITSHCDFDRISEFLLLNKMGYKCVFPDRLVDIGGIVNIGLWQTA